MLDDRADVIDRVGDELCDVNGGTMRLVTP